VILAEVAVYAVGAALIVSMGGLVTLRRMRHRSLSVQPAVVVATTVLAIAITLDVTISGHDRSVALTVAAVDGVAGLAISVFLGRRLAAAHRSVGAGPTLSGPGPVLPAELAELTRELAAAHARLTTAQAREREQAASRRRRIALLSHELRTPLAGLEAAASAISADPDAARRHYGVVRAEAERLSGLVDELFALSSDSAANSAMPSSNATAAAKPSSPRALSGEATIWRTSPSR
jgi:signal transduction histidine kinase